MEPAVHVMALVSGPDEHQLLQKVKTDAQLAALGAERLADSVVAGESAYDVESGYVVQVPDPTGPSHRDGAPRRLPPEQALTWSAPAFTARLPRLRARRAGLPRGAGAGLEGAGLGGARPDLRRAGCCTASGLVLLLSAQRWVPSGFGQAVSCWRSSWWRSSWWWTSAPGRPCSARSSRRRRWRCWCPRCGCARPVPSWPRACVSRCSRCTSPWRSPAWRSSAWPPRWRASTSPPSGC